MHYIYQRYKMCELINDVDLPTSGVITLEEYLNKDNRPKDWNTALLVKDCDVFEDRPILTSLTLAKTIFANFNNVRDYYISPEIIDKEFAEWFAKKYPMHILSLPLTEMDYDIAKGALIIALHTLENTKKYSYQWFGQIFRQMPEKFKDADMCTWAYNNDRDLIRYIPKEHTNYEMYYNLSSGTFVWLEDVPREYRDERMCSKFLQKTDMGDHTMNLGAFPREYKTKELCYKLFEKSANVIIYIPKEYITYQMALDAAKRVTCIEPSTFLSAIPARYQTQSFWARYVNYHWYYKMHILRVIPLHLRTAEFIEDCKNVAKQWYNTYLEMYAKKAW